MEGKKTTGITEKKKKKKKKKIRGGGGRKRTPFSLLKTILT